MVTMSLVESVNIAKEKLGKNIFKDLNISFSDSSKNLLIKRDGKNIKIFYHELVELFRALTYIKEHINENKYEIVIKRQFKKNGLMLDCSRNGVFNLNALKEMILLEALMGQNRLLLYMEDVYTLKKYPYFGYFRGPYTKEELKEIVNYASSFGVELVPCIQTLGHLARFLHWAPNIPLSDGPTTLLINEDKTYIFIEECIKFLRECFKCTDIHIGMDESTEIGLGRYLDKHPYTNRVKLFTTHLARVIKICEKYNFKPMIWSDMFFRLNTKKQEYYRDTPLPKETLKLIPKGVSLVYWDYYHEDKKIYDQMNQYHKDTKRKIVFAGGAWAWKGFAPSIAQSLKRSRAAIASCVDYHIEDAFITVWGDNGNECSKFTALPTLALYASYDYFKKDDNKTISSLLKAITGEDLDNYLLMDLPDMPDNKVLLAQYNPSKYFFYQDPLCGIFDDQVEPHYAKNYLKHAETLKKAAKVSRDYAYLYNNLSLLCSILSLKVDLGVKLRKAYKAHNLNQLKQVIQRVPQIIKYLDQFKKDYKRQWDKENKTFGFDVIDGRLGYLKNRLETTFETVNLYLKGQIKQIEELEVKVLPYDGCDNH
ncbi:MAG: beta-N-acetylhexosaminidase [Bacilli bacterium]|nr:beta-N-acetylhexosaminidase [Bacilli bacterium]